MRLRPRARSPSTWSRWASVCWPFRVTRGYSDLRAWGCSTLLRDIDLETLYEGGTGSRSESLEQPTAYPDRMEAGTPNSPGIAGLGAGIGVVEREGVAESGRRQCESGMAALQGSSREVSGITVHGPWGAFGARRRGRGLESARWHRSSVWPIDGLASAEVAHVLDKRFRIAVRAGLHCAPEAHRVAGTLEGGLVRLSVGHTTTRPTWTRPSRRSWK